MGVREVGLGVREVGLGVREVGLGVREVGLGVRDGCCFIFSLPFSVFLSLYVNVTQSVLDVPVLRTAGTFGTVSTIYYVVSQNATNGSDYIVANYLNVSFFLLITLPSGHHWHDLTHLYSLGTNLCTWPISGLRPSGHHLQLNSITEQVLLYHTVPAPGRSCARKYHHQ